MSRSRHVGARDVPDDASTLRVAALLRVVEARDQLAGRPFHLLDIQDAMVTCISRGMTEEQSLVHIAGLADEREVSLTVAAQQVLHDAAPPAPLVTGS